MIKEFKEFALRGNVFDLAVGFILGAAFGKIVTSIVNDILMPPIGLLLGKVDFSNLFINLTGETFNSLADAQAAGAPTINYGLFISTIIDFLFVAFAMFIIIKQYNRLKSTPQETPAAPDTKECPYCMTEIALKATRCPNCTSQLS